MNVNREELQGIFDSFEWHQRWEVTEGLFTPGTNSVERLMTDGGVPPDLTGKSVLDLGAWNGCCSFECERRGAARVVALSLEDPERTGFSALKRLLGSRVEYEEGSVYSLSPKRLGRFDLVLFFGVLYHLRYPLLAFDQIYNVAAHEVLVETHVIDRRFPLRRPIPLLEARLLPRLLANTPVWRQYGPFELHPGDQSNWFGPNIVAVIEAMNSAGFECVLRKLRGDRATFRATRLANRSERLNKKVYESYAPNRELIGLDPASEE